MSKIWVIPLALLVTCSCTEQMNRSRIEPRIARIENGLIPQNILDFKKGVIQFDSLERIFATDGDGMDHPATLAERMTHYKTPGLSMAVIHNDQIEWAKGYGVLDVNTGAPVTTETIFEAASTSKLVAAVMALHFVQKGLIDLDVDVNNYLTSWKVPGNSFTRSEKVTLRRLLTHQSGIPSTSYSVAEGGDYPTLVDVLNGKQPAENKPAVPQFVPGSRWQYSNLGYNVIQLLLEDVSGKTFQRLAEEIVFRPLGMTSSTFVYPLGENKQNREAMPHDEEGNSRLPVMHHTALAQGGLTTTPTDLAKFTLELMRSFHGKSEKILPRQMIRRMFSKECGIDREKFPLPFDQGQGVLLMGEGENLLFTHPGNNYPGLSCWLIGWPEAGTGAVIMDNAANYGALSIEIIRAVKKEYNL